MKQQQLPIIVSFMDTYTMYTASATIREHSRGVHSISRGYVHGVENWNIWYSHNLTTLHMQCSLQITGT